MIASKETCAQSTPPETNPITVLNDAFRRGLSGGRLALTTGIIALGHEALNAIIVRVRDFDDFTYQNDPYGEHDFGALDWQGTKIFWKIDYYDAGMSAGSADPANASTTARVLTVMLASEY